MKFITKRNNPKCIHSKKRRIAEVRVFSYILDESEVTALEEGNRQFVSYCLYCNAKLRLTKEQLNLLLGETSDE